MTTSSKIQDIKILYERGVPSKLITEIHSISRQTISKYATKYKWTHPRYRPSKLHENIEANTKRAFRERRSAEIKISKRHHQEFQIVRRLIQSAIDHENLEKVSLAKCVSETLLILHQSELMQLELGQVNITASGGLTPRTTTTPRAPAISNGQDKLHHVIPQNIETNATFLELFDQWKIHKSHISPSTASHWRKALSTFSEFVGHSNPQQITRNDVIRWRDWLLAKNYAHKTIESSYIGAPRAVLNYALASGAVRENPFKQVGLPKVKTPRRRSKAYSDQEARLILKSSVALIRGREQEHIYNLRKWGPWLAAYTGARINEICQLRR